MSSSCSGSLAPRRRQRGRQLGHIGELRRVERSARCSGAGSRRPACRRTRRTCRAAPRRSAGRPDCRGTGSRSLRSDSPSLSVTTTRLWIGPSIGIVFTRCMSRWASGRWTASSVYWWMPARPSRAMAATSYSRLYLAWSPLAGSWIGTMSVRNDGISTSIASMSSAFDLVAPQDVLHGIHAPVRGATARVQPDRRPPWWPGPTCPVRRASAPDRPVPIRAAGPHRARRRGCRGRR